MSMSEKMESLPNPRAAYSMEADIVTAAKGSTQETLM
jgi:hypothetical protein